MNLPIKLALDESFFFEEEREGFLVTAESKRLWAVLLDLLVEFDGVCKKFSIKYSLDSGSLLGAVRHKGFIPWDNDLDVIMLRSDYEKLCEVAHQAFSFPYFWQTPNCDLGSARRHAQLRNSQTTYILKEESLDGKPLYDFNQGVFLDVFVLDEVPDDSDTLKEWQHELLSFLPFLYDYKQFYYLSHKSEWMADALRQVHKEYEHLCGRFNGTGQQRIGNISLIPDRKEEKMLPSEILENMAEYEFEGFRFPGPADYDTYLTRLYGNWREPVQGGELHEKFLVDTDTPYLVYLQDMAKMPTPALHPVIGLQKHRDQLLFQRDRAWEDLTRLNAIIEVGRKRVSEEKAQLENEVFRLGNKVQRYRKQVKVFVMILVLCVFSLLFVVVQWLR